jgi:hypothetical protein
VESYQNFDDGDEAGLCNFDLIVPTDVSCQPGNVLLNSTDANALRHGRFYHIV